MRILLFDEGDLALLFARSPTLKVLSHGSDLFEIFRPALGGLIPADLPRALHN